MKLFGEYIKIDNGETMNLQVTTAGNLISRANTYITSYISEGNANGSNVTVTSTRDTSNLSNVYIEFISGDTVNLSSNLYVANVLDSSTFTCLTANSINVSGTLYYSSI